MAEATTERLEPGSFRDRDSRVYYDLQRVLRSLSARGLEEWETLSGKAFFADLLERGDVVGTLSVE